MKIGICKLCKKKKELIRQSHIIPNFMYKGLFYDSQTVRVINPKKLDAFKSIPTGFYNKSFLCENCDRNIIGRLETYASVVLYGGCLKPLYRGKYFFLAYDSFPVSPGHILIISNEEKPDYFRLNTKQ
jgi:hypothetical protein